MCIACHRDYGAGLGTGRGQRWRLDRTDGHFYKVEATKTADPTRRPSAATLARWSNDGIAKATDGCRVEPDGTCPHGHPSWLLKLGLV